MDVTRYFLCIILSLICIIAESQEPGEIILLSRDAVKVESFEAISTLTITDSRGNERVRKNTMASRTFPDDTEKRIIKFLSPAEVKGTGILIFDYPDKADDMWIYLPALRKTRRIVSSERGNSFMGSEFTNGDMSAPSVKDFNYTLLGSEDLEAKACWKIEARPVNIDLEDEYGYSARVLWIEKEHFLIIKTEYYDIDGKLEKTITNSGYKIVDQKNNGYMVTDMFAKNHQNGRSSRMIMNELEPTQPDEKYFTVTFLER